MRLATIQPRICDFCGKCPEHRQPEKESDVGYCVDFLTHASRPLGNLSEHIESTIPSGAELGVSPAGGAFMASLPLMPVRTEEIALDLESVSNYIILASSAMGNLTESQKSGDGQKAHCPRLSLTLPL